jgi:NosR/NirI family nitrous oxide reductase transcriptional regulator
MNKLRISLFIVAIISLITGSVFLSGKKTDERLYVNDLVPGQVFSDKKGAPPRYETATGISVFNSYDLAPEIRGYAGPIKLLLALNTKGEITGIKIVEHRETTNYVHYMVSSDYLKQFIGKSVYDPFEIDRDIDAISRATESVQALIRTVSASSRTFASQVYGLKIIGEGQERQFGAGWLIYALLFLISLTFYYLTRKSGALLRVRDLTLVMGFIIIGIYLATPFSILHLFNLVLLRISSSPLWYIIVGSTLLSLVIAGRFYCGWLCPFGALAEFAGRLPFRKWHVSKENDAKWRKLKYILLLLIIAIAFTGRHIEYVNFETYVTLFSFHGSIPAWSLVALMLIVNIRVKRFWCRYLCPVAAFTGLFSRQDRLYISGHDCPMGNRPDPDTSECIRCNRCYTGVSDCDLP